MEFGILSLVPPLVVIVLAIWTKRSFEPLVAGCVAGYLMLSPGNFFGKFVESLTKVLMDESMVWIILVCGFYGSMIELIVRSGGAAAFGEKTLRYVKNRRGALVMTWLLGAFIFLDDYMSALTTGSTMRRITDRFKISREMLAFLVNTTAAPLCVIVPLSTWSIYVGKLIEKEGLVGEGEWFRGFLYTIPYMFYAWVAVLLALGVALGWVPVVGKLKIFEKKALDKTPGFSDGQNLENQVVGNAMDFLLPLLVLIAATVFFEVDALRGVVFAVVFTIAFYLMRRRMTYDNIFNGLFDGFKSMMLALAILTMSYVLKNVGDEMGLTQFVVESIRDRVSAATLPAIVFLAMCFISYTTASSWGMYAIVIPLVVPIAQAQGANIWLTLAAVISAGAFGSHACMYSDATILTATSSECDNVEHSLSQFPYALAAVGVAALLFFVFGFLG